MIECGIGRVVVLSVCWAGNVQEIGDWAGAAVYGGGLSVIGLDWTGGVEVTWLRVI